MLQTVSAAMQSRKPRKSKYLVQLPVRLQSLPVGCGPCVQRAVARTLCASGRIAAVDGRQPVKTQKTFTFTPVDAKARRYIDKSS